MAVGSHAGSATASCRRRPPVAFASGSAGWNVTSDVLMFVDTTICVTVQSCAGSQSRTYDSCAVVPRFVE